MTKKKEPGLPFGWNQKNEEESFEELSKVKCRIKKLQSVFRMTVTDNYIIRIKSQYLLDTTPSPNPLTVVIFPKGWRTKVVFLTT